MKARERGVQHAQEVVLLGDGAPWIWQRLGSFFPQAVQILDWHHAQSYLVRVAQELFGLESPDGTT